MMTDDNSDVKSEKKNKPSQQSRRQKSKKEEHEKLQVTEESSPFSKTYIFADEDHTLGNSLRHVIMQDPEVDLCGYTIPHPLENKMNMRIQTKKTKKADKALEDGLNSLIAICDKIEKKFDDAVDEYARQGGTKTS